MSIKRYIANKDNTITNAYEPNLTTRGTGSNMGASDVLEVFSIFGQQDPDSSEKSRILVAFPVDDMISDRSASFIPASGNVNFYLRLFNAEHSNTLPSNFTLNVKPISKDWEEGTGLDMESYRDLTFEETGSNWVFAASGSTWTSEGGDYLAHSNLTASFSLGYEDLDLDITEIVEEWLQADGGYENFGLGIHLINSQESGSTSYYTKKFFSRTSEFFFKRPFVEARWDSSIKDDRGDLYASSSLVDHENTHTLYLYNHVKGHLRNIPGITAKGNAIQVRIFTSASNGTEITTIENQDESTGVPITGGYESQGIYSASFSINTDVTAAFDRWESTDGTVYHTGSFKIKRIEASNYNPNSSYVTTIPNLKPIYSKQEDSRFRLFVREKDWSPTIYTKATKGIEGTTIRDAYYRIFRKTDDYEIIPYGTSSDNYTKLSCDASGSYFDLDMNLLEAGYAYGMTFIYSSSYGYVEQPEVFKFRVE